MSLSQTQPTASTLGGCAPSKAVGVVTGGDETGGESTSMEAILCSVCTIASLGPAMLQFGGWLIAFYVHRLDLLSTHTET